MLRYVYRDGDGVDSMRTLPHSCTRILIWVIITIRLLCFHLNKNRFMEKGMKEHPENGPFSHFGLRVCTLFRSKIFTVMKMKTKKII